MVPFIRKKKSQVNSKKKKTLVHSQKKAPFEKSKEFKLKQML